MVNYNIECYVVKVDQICTVSNPFGSVRQKGWYFAEVGLKRQLEVERGKSM